MLENETKNHHIRNELCLSRAPYRQGRKLLSVKVYTVSKESQYLLVQGVPSVGAHKNLIELFALYGTVDEYKVLDEYPAEEFTEVFWIKYQHISSARIAKKKLDDFNFFGNVLHVCYAPEFETLDETRRKLQHRRIGISRRLQELEKEQALKKPSNVTAISAKDDDEQCAYSFEPEKVAMKEIHFKDSNINNKQSQDSDDTLICNTDEIYGDDSQMNNVLLSDIDLKKYSNYKGSQLPHQGTDIIDKNNLFEKKKQKMLK